MNEWNRRLEYDNSKYANIHINRFSEQKSKKILLETESGKNYIWKDDVIYDANKKSKVLLNDYKDKLKIELKSFIKNVTNSTYDYDESLNLFVAESITHLNKLLNQ